MNIPAILIATTVSVLSVFGDVVSRDASTAVRVFQTDTNVFVPHIRGLVGTNEWKYQYVLLKGCLTTNSHACLQESPSYSEILREHFLVNGIELRPPSMLFYNESTGELCVRSTAKNFDRIRALVRGINSKK